MSARHVVVALVAVVCIVLPVVVCVMTVAQAMPVVAFYLVFAPAPLAFASAGWILAVRRPDLVLGPLCLLFAFVFAVYFPIDLLIRLGAREPALLAAATASSASDAPGFITVAMILILFPDGRLPGPRWRWTIPVAVAGSIASLVGFGVQPGRLAAFPDVINPFGIEGVPGALLGEVGYVSLLALLVAGVAALGSRWRRGHPVERTQIKWVGAASVGLLAAEVLNLATFDPANPLGAPVPVVLASAGTALVPLAIVIAILRYRLYDIDRLISRGLAYLLVTGVIGAAFAGTIVTLQAALAPFTQGQAIAVAASTLVAAALFQPVRTRVQAAADRRFDRRRADAHREVDAFASRLRDEVDLSAVIDELDRVVGRAVAPSRRGVWLRGIEPRR